MTETVAVRIGLINAGRGGIALVGEAVLRLAAERRWDVVAVTEAHIAEGSAVSLRDEFGSLLDAYRVVFQPRHTTESNRPPGGVLLMVRDDWCGSAGYEMLVRCRRFVGSYCGYGRRGGDVGNGGLILSSERLLHFA